MSRLETPLQYYTLWSTGDLILQAFLELRLKDTHGNWHPQVFRVDSASDITTLPAFEAKQMGLPLLQRPSPVRHEQTGLEVRSGYIRRQVVGMDQTEYAFPCYFLGDPDTHPNSNTPLPRRPRYLLGLSGVVDKIRWSFDGTPGGLQAPYGYPILEKI